MGVKVGIDLGTTFCAVAWRNPRTNVIEVVRSDRYSDKMITPSAVQVTEDGSRICGAMAKEAFENDEGIVATAFKRSMGTDDYQADMPDGKTYSAEELSTILLSYLKECAEESIRDTIDEAVITVPAYFEDGPRQATRRAAEKAGLKVRDIINEPTAAALNYGLNHWRENAKILVYDLGGGTFDVTLIGMQKGNNLVTIGSVGEHRRGGRDWDECLTQLAAQKLMRETGCEQSELSFNELRSQAENWKITLSRQEKVSIEAYVEGYGPASVEVTRKEFDRETFGLLNMTGNLCDALLNDLKVSWKDITDVLLVGGSTRMPQVAEYLTAKLGKAPITHVNPDLAVALGAAIRANMGKNQIAEELTIISEELDHSELLMSLDHPVRKEEYVELEDVTIHDSVAHALGIILADRKQLKYVNRTILPKYVPTPCKRAIKTIHSDSELNIYVVQGDGDIAACTVNHKYVVTGIKKSREGTLVRVQYSYDANHTIHVQARQNAENRDLPIREEDFTEEEIREFMKPIDPEMFAPPRITIVLAVDVSGSMNGDPLKEARKAMKDFVSKYGNQANFGVIAVSDRSEWVIRPTDDLGQVIRGIDSITECMTGVCNEAHPFKTLQECYTDGERYVGIVMADGRWDDQNEAIRVAKICHKKGIDIIGIGFGSADKKFLRDISNNPDLVQYTSTSAGLGASFGKIAQTLSSGTAAQKQKMGYHSKRGAKNEDDSCDTWETGF